VDSGLRLAQYLAKYLAIFAVVCLVKIGLRFAFKQFAMSYQAPVSFHPEPAASTPMSQKIDSR
jgi:hypothetical protein